MKNLLILHLESITCERLAAFASSFPNTHGLLRNAVAFDSFFSSATSTLMVVSYLFHGNDFEFDASTQFEGMRPAANNPHLFATLQAHGWQADLICLNGFHAMRPTTLAAWPGELPPIFGTNDFPTLFTRFDALTDRRPFAIYVWDLITHVEHSLALAAHSAGLTEQVRQACRVADDAIGVMLSTLERKGLLGETTIVVYGDHGDDYWTHGFKGGMVHATEPYTQITHAPLAFCDPTLAPGNRAALASTIDIAPTCLALLGVDAPLPFARSGGDLFGTPDREFVYAQNFTASQPDSRELGIARAFAATDDTYNLVASSRGLEFFAYRLDPGNHCNLLQFFRLGADGALRLRDDLGTANHFRAALIDNPRAVAHLADRFAALRRALAARVAEKRAYLASRGVAATAAMDPAAFDRIALPPHSAGARDVAASPARPALAPFEFSFKLG